MTDAATPPPPPPPDRLTRFNTLVTVLAGACTLTIGVWVKMNEAQLKEIEKTTKQIESREKVEEASYKFAREFLAQIKGNFSESNRGTQLAVAALNIIAQASSASDGSSSAKARSELPIHMALLLGDAGSIVTLDPDQQHLERWCEFAAVDDDDRTRVTAIRALCALCRQSVRGGFLDRIDSCTAHIDQLYRLLAESDTPSAIEQRASALVAKSKLKAFLTQYGADLKAAKLREGDARSAPAVLAGVMARFESTVDALQDSKVKLQRAVANADSAQRRDPEPVGAGPGAPAAAPLRQQQQQQALISVDEALQAVAFAQNAPAEPPPASSLPAPVGAGPEPPKPAEEAQLAEIKKLIDQLASSDTPARRKARSDLALFRQAAVKPMLATLRERERESPQNVNVLYNTRLGVATALSRMVQPITLDAEQAAQVAALIGAPDADTRIATADFLMNLESSATIQNVYNAISVLLKNKKGPGESGNLVKNSTSILGTWARVLSPDNRATDGTPMKEFARSTVEQLRYQLEKEDAAGWSQTIAVAKELLERATARSAAF